MGLYVQIHMYKAHIVVKGFKQEQGVNFNEIFSPVDKKTMLRMMLTLAAKRFLSYLKWM